MLRPSIVFDYPIKRPYPWRFTTLLIFSVSALVLAGLIYINVAIAGLTSTSFPSTTFEKTPDLSWFERVNLKKAMSTRICEPATLESGRIYRTRNGVFPYNVQQISSSEPGGTLSSQPYEGQVIEYCEETLMSVDGGRSAEDTKFTATTTCSFSGGTNLTIGFSTHEIDGLGFEPQNQMAQKASQLVSLLAVEPELLLWGNFHGSDGKSDPCGFNTVLVSGTPDPATYDLMWGICENMKHMSNQLMAMQYLLLIYLQVLRSAIYLDLGVKSPDYLFSNPKLMRRALQPNIHALEKLDTLNGYKIYDVLQNMTGYGLPLEEPQPVQFHAQYLCHGMAWKSPSNLVLDVLVATVSLFMAYWAILNFVLQYFATTSSPHGNHCICTNCNELPHHAPSSPAIHELRPLDGGTEGKPFPSRSQSTPVSASV